MLLIVCLLSLILALVWYWRYQFTYWERRKFPYAPLDSYLLGNMVDAGTKLHIADVMDRIYRKFKGKERICGIFLFNRPSALIIDPELVRNVMVKDFHAFSSRGINYNEEFDPLSGHLFNLHGQKWKRMRGKLSPTFTPAFKGKMKWMFEIIAMVAKELNETMSETIKDSNEVVIREICMRYTSDSIGNCAFGIEVNSLKEPDNEFRKMGNRVSETFNLVRAIFMIVFPALIRWLRMKQFPSDIEQFFINVVRETIEYREKNNVKRKDFLDLLIQLKNHGHLEDEGSAGDGDVLSLNEIAAQCFLFFVAGFDTSSLTMTFALYELAMRQDIQNRLRKEIKNAIEAHNGQLAYELLNECPYLDQVVKETLRLYPIATDLVRATIEDYPIPDSNITIPKGTQIWIPAYSLHRDPDYWPDPLKFDPDRFNPENSINRSPYVHIPFGIGPRSCIGMRFGLMQTKLGLISLLRDFRFSPCAKTIVPMEYLTRSPLLQPNDGVTLHVERL